MALGVLLDSDAGGARSPQSLIYPCISCMKWENRNSWRLEAGAPGASLSICVDSPCGLSRHSGFRVADCSQGCLGPQGVCRVPPDGAPAVPAVARAPRAGGLWPTCPFISHLHVGAPVPCLSLTHSLPCFSHQHWCLVTGIHEWALADPTHHHPLCGIALWLEAGRAEERKQTLCLPPLGSGEPGI